MLNAVFHISVANARDLPRESLAEVAFLSGFSDQTAFTRAFKRWTGRTPAAYREAGP